ncbi:MAG: hypothetical protein IT443_08345 [Phycisphaeraceae bacterium]|nr:hypothetical protein [Phycisphaeraceae bacterium]
MRKKALRWSGVLVGLTLGWLAAGQVGWSNPLPAEHAGTPAVAPAAAEHSEASAPAQAGGEHAGEDMGAAAADQLVPRDANGQPAWPDWYRYVIGGIVGLFALAVLLGLPASKLKTPVGPERPAVAAVDHHASAGSGHHQADH